ncbi:signal recognition particle-docking protein FtsY [Paraglaciecola sp.]|uniref:signal recognition particle-docking protein FtsY n=1 Tax=Paraglaciecola sp. TaxID=1920173 RepID=UPI00273F2E7D|nr:signal recognition particle-docking protein FtsY [Paraglaciecola sp.]MDP5030082.1 signal recognition particle-docking protein FtsY [Paraglaciecola sp.]
MSKFFSWLSKDKKKEETSQPVEPISTDDTATKNEPEEAPELAEIQKAAAQVTDDPVIGSSERTLPVVEEMPPESTEGVIQTEVVAKAPEELSLFARLKKGLSRTTESIGSGLANLFRGKAIDDELFEELETQLLIADVGITTTRKMVAKLTESADRKQLKDADALFQLLKQQMVDILSAVDNPLTIDADKKPYVILMVGVNGVGKTTTIGKMAKQFQQQGKKVMLAAGDTFRAAAVEQLQVWGERNNIPVVAQQSGADSASVIFDAFQSAKAKNIDVLIADTAGRLQNKDHLMEELKKVVRVMKKIDPQAPHEIMLTLDAGTGQNALSQTKLFNEAVGLSGLTLTKLDGTAKGGVIFAIADQFPIPIRYIGVGEGIEDLRPFNSKEFVEALFSGNEKTQSKQKHH